ncbi:MAG: virginiamycin B lyase family protein [Vicinamibacterales bacterium]
MTRRVVPLPLSAGAAIAGAGLALVLAERVDARQEASAPVIREYAVGAIDSGPAILAVDESGAVWVALAKAGRVVRYTSDGVRTYDIGKDSRPVGLAVGTRDNGHPGVIWVTASYDNKLVRLTVDTGAIDVFPTGENSWPFNVAIARDGSIWFTERGSGTLGRLKPGGTEAEHLEIPTPNSGPAGLAVDPTTGAIWFTESYADAIGMYDPDTHAFREFKMGTSSTGLVTGPAGLALDASGGVWFAKLEGRLGHLPSRDASIRLIDLPGHAKRPAGVAVGPDGDVWAAALDGNLLVRFRRRDGSIQTYPIPTGEPDAEPSVPPQARTARPFGIAHDREGNVWFSEQYTGQIGVLDAAAPEVSIVSPAGSVRSVVPFLTLMTRERVSGITRIDAFLDGVPAPVAAGRVSLAAALPGRHTIGVRVTDGAGHVGTSTASFEYAPADEALARALRSLHPLTADAEARIRSLQERAEALPPPGEVAARAKALQAIRSDLALAAPGLQSFPDRLLNALLVHLGHVASPLVEVSMRESPPFFDPPRIEVRAGRTVTWRRELKPDAHAAQRPPFGVRIAGPAGPAQSPPLRPGDTFSHAFRDPGTYIVTSSDRPDTRSTVVVVP